MNKTDKMLHGVEIEEIVANKCLIGLGDSIANLDILYIHDLDTTVLVGYFV